MRSVRPGWSGTRNASMAANTIPVILVSLENGPELEHGR